MKSFAITITLTLFVIVVAVLLYDFNVLPHRQYTNADFGITPYRSQKDQDGDGIDDQTDLLQSVRNYLATRPRYQSKYYAGGYPDDGYGVCTDVVAFGAKGAGHDLMNLVDQDARESPELYDIETPDKNIDFRRVKNLDIYFLRHAQRLTTDLDRIEEWQGGDIVVFPTHIGIVSDKRNRHGVPFLLHHYSPFQFTYEEDVLENYRPEDIIGHYRLN